RVVLLPTLFRPQGIPASGTAEARRPVERSLRQSIEARVLETFAPADVVVTREGDIVNYSAGTGQYLEAPPGRPSRALIAMARRGLRLPLRSALQEAIESGRSAVRDGLPVDADNENDL